jgi:hypothetical protein
MKKILMFSLLIAVTSHVFAVPTITKSVSAGTTFKFTETLSEKLPTGYKVKIDLNNGKGLVAMTCSGTTCTLSSNALPKVDTSIYKVGIYDAKGVLQGALLNGEYTITFSATSSGYTKISNIGNPLPDSSLLGGWYPEHWECTKDNKTGLVWEVKSADGGLRDMNIEYTNYFVGETGYGSNTNSDQLVKIANKLSMCGAANWRLPTHNELMTLVVCSDGKYDKDGYCLNQISSPTINSIYFPNTSSNAYWASESDGTANILAWLVDFHYGYSGSSNKKAINSVRLVHN